MFSLHKVSSRYRLDPWSCVIVNIPLGEHLVKIFSKSNIQKLAWYVRISHNKNLLTLALTAQLHAILERGCCIMDR